MQLPLLLLPGLNLTLPSFKAHSTPSPEIPCPFDGQIYPPPAVITSTQSWKKVVAELHRVFDASPLLRDNSASYAVRIVSLHDSSPLFEHYHRAAAHVHGENGTAPINADTVFRIASVSKLFTVYTLLLKCGFKCFEEPVTKYIPELKSGYESGNISHVDWEEVTIGGLASQLSGIARDTVLGDLTTNPFVIPGSQIGLPDISDIDSDEVPTCGAAPDQPPCNRKEALKRIKSHAPTFLTWYTPAYSNIAYQLLGLVLENITGQPYDQLLQETIVTPLDLKYLSTKPPNDSSRTVQIPGDTMFGWDFGFFNPTGGIYTSVRDLTTHALAVLNNTQLSPSQVRRWLKPHSHTSNPRVSIGAPWEIGRAQGLSPFHTIDIYTKGGNLSPYTTMYGILPDLNIAFAVNCLTASPIVSAPLLAGLALQNILGPLYGIAKDQAFKRFGGTYLSNATSTSHPSKLTVTTDSEVGLVLSEFISNGTDILGFIRDIGLAPQTVRLFPSASSSTSKKVGRKSKIAFRASLINDGGTCASWGTVGGMRWAGESLDLFIFEIEDEEPDAAISVHLPAFRRTFKKTTETVVPEVETEAQAEL